MELHNNKRKLYLLMLSAAMIAAPLSMVFAGGDSDTDDDCPLFDLPPDELVR